MYFAARIPFPEAAKTVAALALIAFSLAAERTVDVAARLQTRGKLRRMLHAPGTYGPFNFGGRGLKDRHILIYPEYRTENPSIDPHNSLYLQATRLTQQYGAWTTHKHLDLNVRNSIAVGDHICALRLANLFAIEFGTQTETISDVQLIDDIAHGNLSRYEHATLIFIGLYSNFATNLLAATLSCPRMRDPEECRNLPAEDPRTIISLSPTDQHKGPNDIFLRNYDENGNDALPKRIHVEKDEIEAQDRDTEDYVTTEFFYVKVPLTIKDDHGDKLTMPVFLVAGLTEVGTCAAGCYLGEHWSEIPGKRCGPNNKPIGDSYFVGALRRNFCYRTLRFSEEDPQTNFSHFAALRQTEYWRSQQWHVVTKLKAVA
jgi:hypothetical protein